jgi:hypothetical protein
MAVDQRVHEEPGPGTARYPCVPAVLAGRVGLPRGEEQRQDGGLPLARLGATPHVAGLVSVVLAFLVDLLMTRKARRTCARLYLAFASLWARFVPLLHSALVR